MRVSTPTFSHLLFEQQETPALSPAASLSAPPRLQLRPCFQGFNLSLEQKIVLPYPTIKALVSRTKTALFAIFCIFVWTCAIYWYISLHIDMTLTWLIQVAPPLKIYLNGITKLHTQPITWFPSRGTTLYLSLLCDLYIYIHTFIYIHLYIYI